MRLPAAMLEIRRTIEVPEEPEGLQVLMDDGRLYPQRDEDWPEERHLLGECVILDGARAVGFGRVIWDAHTDDLPRVADLALDPALRSDFFIDSLEQELIAEYAAEAEGGDVVRGHDGRLIDITGIAAGEGRHAAPRSQRRPRA